MTTMRRARALAGGLCLLTQGVQAGGFEWVDNGAVSNGRGGAFVARANDATAMMHNVAGIGTGSQRRLQIWVGANLSSYSSCFQRAGAYDGGSGSPQIDRGGGAAVDPTQPSPGTIFTGSASPTNPLDFSAGDFTGRAYPQVCNDAGIFPAPQVMATYAITPRLAVGFGIYGPNSVGRVNFPDRLTVQNAMGQTIPAPGPARYILIKEDLLIVHPTLAVAFQAIPGLLRLGVSLSPSIAHFQFSTMANTANSQSPATDIRTDVSATGFFLAGNLGFLLTPTPFLAIGGQAHLTTNVDLSGSGSAVTYPYAAERDQIRTPNFGVDSLRPGLAHNFRLGARFVLPRAGGVRLNDPNPSRPHDPMLDEIADLEVNGFFELSSAFENLSLRFRPTDTVCVGATRNMAGEQRCATSSALPNIDLPHRWQNVMGLRVGGDVNILPGVLSARAGFAFETGSNVPQYQNFDIPGPKVFSVHTGWTLRIHNRFSFSLAYAHHFASTVDNTNVIPASGSSTPYTDANAGLRTIGTSGLVGNTACNDQNMAGGGACSNNRGVFTSSLDVLSLGANLAF